MARLLPGLLTVLLCAAIPLIAAQPYPVDVDVGSFTPRRGEALQYWIDVKAHSSVDVIVNVAIYVPGYGWSDWQKLWEGHVYAGEEKRVYGSYHIPDDADVGSVVIWCTVLYYSPDDYEVIAGKKYYADYSTLYVAGSLSDPSVEYWASEAEYWKSQAEYWEGLYNSSSVWKDRYYELLDDYNALSEEYGSLVSEYSALKRSFDAMVNNYTKLKAEYDHLLVINEQLKRERDALLGQVSALQLMPILAALAGVIAGAVTMYIHQRRGRAVGVKPAVVEEAGGREEVKGGEKAVYCPYCGEENPPGALYCKKCGKRIG